MNKPIIKRTAAFFMTLCLICLTVLVSASAAPEQTTGTLKIKVEPRYEGIGVTILELGTYAGEYEINDQFASVGLDFNNVVTMADIMEEANKAQDYALENDIIGDIARIDIDGEINFYNLDTDKLYLIYQFDGFERVKIQPVVVTVPSYTEDKEPYYDITVDAKHEDRGSKIYTAAVILNKINNIDERLEGATFSFWRKVYYTDASKLKDDAEIGEDGTGTYYWKRFGADLTTDKNGQLSAQNLPFGGYRFIEIEAPSGYVLDDTPHEFTLSKHSTIKVENDMYVADVGVPVELTVINEPVSESEPPEESGQSTPESQPKEPSEYSEISATSTPGAIHSGDSDNPGFQLTGDDIVKYVLIGGAVCVSLAVIIILIITGNKKNKKKK